MNNNTNDSNRREVTADDFDDLSGVPTYREGSGNSRATGDIYQRTGKAAPTEVFPNATPQGAPSAAVPAQPTEQFPQETVSIDRQPVQEPLYDTTPVDPVGMDPAVADAEPRARRGTIDLGLLILRLIIGGYLILDAVKVFFRLGGSDGITGLENAYSAYTYGGILAVVLPTLELAAGVFLLLGLLAPVAAMVAVAVTGFFGVHALAEAGTGADVLMWGAPVWLALLLLGASVALQFTGPGFYSVDAGRSWARRPLASSWIFAVLGVAAAALIWWFGTGVNPLA